MKKLLVLLAAVCAVSVLAESTVLKVIDFETSEGYNPGPLKGQNDWTWDYSSDDANVVVNDATVAPSGSQYYQMGDASNDARGRVLFDISSQYEAGCKLRISWFSAGKTGKTHFAKLHDIGTTGKRYNVEICELQLYGTTVQLDVSKEDKTGLFSIKTSLPDITVFHEFSVLIDPSDKTIKEFTVDDDVIFDGSSVYYYKSEAAGDAIGQGGNLIDGVRLQGHGAFDGLKVEMVPEPAFFGLVALLGLFFARKQR